MRTPIVVLLLGLLTCCALLFAFQVITLPGREVDREDAEDTAQGLRDAAGRDDEGRLLQGRQGPGGRARDPVAAGGATLLEDAPSWQVHGGAPGGARLKGRVVDGKGRIPVAGARVDLMRPDALFTWLRADPRGRFDRLEARTGEDGRFAFLDVTGAKDYVVRVRHGSGDLAAVSVGPLDLRGRPTRDLGDFVLGPRAALRGRVVDGEGRGIADARVASAWFLENPLQIVLADPDTLPEIERETSTAEDGTFTIEGLEPGRKTLVIEAGARGADVVPSVEAVAGETKVVPDVTLAGTSSLAGKVTFPGGKPVAAARVFAAQPGSPAVLTTETDARGVWRIDALPEQPHVVSILVPGLPIHMEQNVEAGRDDVDVELDSVGVVAGRVVREKDGKPVTQFAVQLVSSEESEDWMQNHVQQLIDATVGPLPVKDEEGRFEITPVPVGTYVVRVTADGHPEGTSDLLEVKPGSKATTQIALPAGAGLQGRVLSAGGEGVGGARIHLLPDPMRQMDVHDIESWAEDERPVAVSDPEGRFLLPPQTPGTYHLLALHDEHQPGLRFDVDLGVASDATVEIRLREAGSLDARVVDEAGRPAAAVQVVLVYADGARYFFETDDEGRFHKKPLPTGTALVFWFSLPATKRIDAIHPKAEPEARQAAWAALRGDAQAVEIVPDREAELTLRLPRRVRVHGTLRIDGALASARYGVYFTMDDVPRGEFSPCNEEGSFEHFVAPGSYELYAPDGEWSWKVTSVVVPDTAELRIDLER